MSDREHRLALPSGYRLRGYILEGVLGVGGFGVTYLARDVMLDREVAVKEYLPNEWAVREGVTVHPKSEDDREVFEWGMTRFLEEARILARFRHPNLIRVMEYFEENETAYIVMEYEEGESLDRLLARRGRLGEEEVRGVVYPIAAGLRGVHDAGYLHRDIKPSNVFIRASDGSPVLLDFGAARQAMGRKSRSLTGVVSEGYSPPEQYERGGEQGPWTDIYGLSALCYRAITGEPPVEAPERTAAVLRGRPDPLAGLAARGLPGYSWGFLAGVDAGLRVLWEERPGTLDDWLAGMELGSAPAVRTVESPVTGRAPARSSPPSESAGSKPGPTVGEFVARRRVGPPDSLFWRSVAVSAVAVFAVLLLFVLNWPDGEDDRRNDGGEDSGTSRLSVVGGGRAGLHVDTEPSGVVVRVAGEFAGVTPLRRTDIRAGNHPVTLNHRDYETATLPAELFSDGRVRQITRRLSRLVGSVRVRVQPSSAWVERDGERLATGTPATLQLPVGRVELVLGASGYREERVEVEVRRETTVNFSHRLERVRTGTLTLDLNPPDAQVWLGGTPSSYRRGMQLPEGQYQVRVSRDGYETETRSVRVRGNVRERFDLKPGSAIARELADAERARMGRGPSGPAGMVFEWIPGGEFLMGSTSGQAYGSERPTTDVRITRGFWLGKYEVTQAEWFAVMQTTPSTHAGCGRCPVERVSWTDVQEYIRRLNAREGAGVYRLPTEAEWEYAARAGTTEDRYGTLGSVAWHVGNSTGGSQRVGGKTPNRWGLHDMLGNVFEWVQDWYGQYPGGSVADPKGPGSGSERVCRGGSWRRDQRQARAPNRGRGQPHVRNDNLGFRLVRTR